MSKLFIKRILLSISFLTTAMAIDIRDADGNTSPLKSIPVNLQNLESIKHEIHDISKSFLDIHNINRTDLHSKNSLLSSQKNMVIKKCLSFINDHVVSLEMPISETLHSFAWLLINNIHSRNDIYLDLTTISQQPLEILFKDLILFLKKWETVPAASELNKSILAKKQYTYHTFLPTVRVILQEINDNKNNMLSLLNNFETYIKSNFQRIAHKIYLDKLLKLSDTLHNQNINSAALNNLNKILQLLPTFESSHSLNDEETTEIFLEELNTQIYYFLETISETTPSMLHLIHNNPIYSNPPPTSILSKDTPSTVNPNRNNFLYTSTPPNRVSPPKSIVPIKKTEFTEEEKNNLLINDLLNEDLKALENEENQKFSEADRNSLLPFLNLLKDLEKKFKTIKIDLFDPNEYNSNDHMRLDDTLGKIPEDILEKLGEEKVNNLIHKLFYENTEQPEIELFDYPLDVSLSELSIAINDESSQEFVGTHSESPQISDDQEECPGYKIIPENSSDEEPLLTIDESDFDQTPYEDLYDAIYSQNRDKQYEQNVSFIKNSLHALETLIHLIESKIN